MIIGSIKSGNRLSILFLRGRRHTVEHVNFLCDFSFVCLLMCGLINFFYFKLFMLPHMSTTILKFSPSSPI